MESEFTAWDGDCFLLVWLIWTIYFVVEILTSYFSLILLWTVNNDFHKFSINAQTKTDSVLNFRVQYTALISSVNPTSSNFQAFNIRNPFTIIFPRKLENLFQPS